MLKEDEFFVVVKNEQVKETELLRKIVGLPDVLIEIVYSYLPNKIRVFLNKALYFENHPLIRTFIMKGNMENYIRDMLRRDHSFVFSHLLHENIKKWVFDIKNYKYKNQVYKNYLYFLKEFCLIHESTKCRNIINEYLENNDLCKNQHKKNPVRNIRWTPPP
jgi:hypothetical protein